MYTYKDFVTGKIKRTRGRFSHFSAPTGPLQARYALFKNPCGYVCVPEYCLTPETRARLAEMTAAADSTTADAATASAFTKSYPQGRRRAPRKG